MSTIEKQIKTVYDQLPYPVTDRPDFLQGDWNWVNLKWIESLLPHPIEGDLSFKKILIAGCGTGKEAFQMSNRFPKAEITAIDYSERAIEIAQAWQERQESYTNIYFQVGDLVTSQGGWAKAGYYDFISCHGVMSYIPGAARAFGQLATCLNVDGVLYLGVNGATHIGVAARQSIQHFDQKSNIFDDTPKTRNLIELFDRMRPYQENISQNSAAYLASDILNQFSHNLTLAEWLEYTNAAGLHFVCGSELILNLSKTLTPELFPLLIPKTRAEICKIIGYNNIAPFHRLLFSKQAHSVLPWKDPDALLSCYFQSTRLYRIQYPASTIDGEITLSCEISDSHEMSFSWPIDEVVVQLVKPRKDLPRLCNALSHVIASQQSSEALIEKIFMLYQLGMIKIWGSNPTEN